MSWVNILKREVDPNTDVPLERSYLLIIGIIKSNPNITGELDYTDDGIEGTIYIEGMSGNKYTIVVTPDDHKVFKGDTYIELTTNLESSGSLWHGDRLAGVALSLYNDTNPKIREMIEEQERVGEDRE